ncbi:MAG: hypothetical protein ACFCD0_12295 [Gemmataceae bacterium]
MRQTDVVKIISTSLSGAFLGMLAGVVVQDFVMHVLFSWFPLRDVPMSVTLSKLPLCVVSGLLLGGYGGWQAAVGEIRLDREKEKTVGPKRCEPEDMEF